MSDTREGMEFGANPLTFINFPSVFPPDTQAPRKTVCLTETDDTVDGFDVSLVAVICKACTVDFYE